MIDPERGTAYYLAFDLLLAEAPIVDGRPDLMQGRVARSDDPAQSERFSAIRAAMLAGSGYPGETKAEQDTRVERFACDAWRSEDDMHDAFAARFSFPASYGRTMDALGDCLTDTDVLTVPESGGLAVVLQRLDEWPGRRDVLLNVWAGAAQFWRTLDRCVVALVAPG